MTLKRIFIKTVFLTLLISCSNKITVIHNSDTNYTDYLIRTQELNFSIKDTVIKTNICVRPDGTFNFIDSIGKKHWIPDSYFQKKVGDSIINYKEKYISRNQEVITLNSYFPPLIVHDSSVINHYDFPDEWNFGFAYEMEYSSILANLKEPIVKKFSEWYSN